MPRPPSVVATWLPQLEGLDPSPPAAQMPPTGSDQPPSPAAGIGWPQSTQDLFFLATPACLAG